MANLSGTVSFPLAGKLRFYLTGTYTRANTDAGFPNYSDGNIRVQAFAGAPGSYSYSPIMDKFQQSVDFDVDYPGGSVVWNVGTEVVEYERAAGTVVVAIRNLKLAWELVLR